MRKKDFCAVFGCNNDRLFSEKYTMEDHISDTKLEKGDHYYIQTPSQGSFFPLLSSSKKTFKKMSRKAPENTNEMCSCPLGIL